AAEIGWWRSVARRFEQGRDSRSKGARAGRRPPWYAPPATMNPTKALALITALLLGTSLFAVPANAQSTTATTKDTSMNTNQETDHYTFELSAKVTRQKVTFANRYGIRLTGDLYLPKNQEGKTLPALAISGPFGAVKEQSSGLYANAMAERGYAVLAFDPSYTGESGGEPRNIASPDINTEDFSAAVDYLGLNPRVDRNRIGILGICGFGGFALNATAVDKRIKAVATSTMYDMTRVASKGYNDSRTLAERTQMLEQMSNQRWLDAERGAPAYGPVMNELKGGEPQFLVDYHDYYRTPRGFHPRSVNSNGSWARTSLIPFMNMPILTYIAEISPRPALFIHGEKAHSRYFSETAYAAAAEPKELLIVPGANHVDLYDRLDKIPFDKLADFFAKNLK
ncbi:MAG TPA: alpha/beta hydrolase, partial [Hyphomonadaceae bacterium]|nr:alpha/beta hydrolase [Hyphomonadaceae bacterium]